ncbi:isoprenylcysteine carboxyl methyltransferase family protein [Siminovitchia fortis]|nr:isoprenylcysteine carboxylmethyltransferase family protein [Siminovitchia fortis]
MFFTIFLTLVIIQRLSELALAKRNERWMKERGGKEYGKGHYWAMVLIHISFFISLIIEVNRFHPTLNTYWKPLLVIFLLAQAARIWIISTLGKYWNTKIIVLPGAKPVKKGPFKYIKHPNYLIVTIELVIIPLIFQAYITAGAFFVLNQLILAVRIPAEEKSPPKTYRLFITPIIVRAILYENG